MSAVLRVMAAMRRDYTQPGPLIDHPDHDKAARLIRGVVITLNRFTDGDDMARYLMLSALFGREIQSTKDLTEAEARAFMQWAFRGKDEIDGFVFSYLSELKESVCDQIPF